MREALWLWALSLRRWRRLLERLLTDAAVRKRLMTGLFGLGGGCLPMLWVLGAFGGRGGSGIAYPEAPVFGLALLVVWLVTLQPALSGNALVLPRPGLTLVLGGPITGRGLLAWWASRAWPGMLILHVLGLGWVAYHVYPTLFFSWRWTGVLGAAVLATAGGMGLLGLVAAVRHRIPPLARTLARIGMGALTAWLVGAVLFLVLHGERSTFLPAPWDGLWLGLVDWSLAAGGAITAPVTAALTAPALGAAHALLALPAAGVVALCWLFAPELEVTSVLEASEARAVAQQELKRTTPKAKRAARLGRFGSGTTALVWKSLAEMEARHGRLALVCGWVVLAAAGIGLGWGLWKLLDYNPGSEVQGLMLFVLAVATAVSCMVGGTSGMGLATEIRHPTWLVRYPLQPGQILAAGVGVPAAGGALVLLVLVLPAVVVAGPYRPLLAVALAAGLAVTLAVRALRMVVWLRFPPGAGSTTLTELLLTAAFLFPLGLACALATAGVVNGFDPVMSLALAGAPCAALAGLCWPAGVRLLRRLEMR